MYSLLFPSLILNIVFKRLSGPKLREYAITSINTEIFIVTKKTNTVIKAKNIFPNYVLLGHAGKHVAVKNNTKRFDIDITLQTC